MSHFAYIFSNLDRGWYGFGKAVGMTYQTAELAILAAQLKDPSAWPEVFDDPHWRWVLEVPSALDRLMAWVRPEGVYTLHVDSGDMPHESDCTPRWWPCIGGLGQEGAYSVFGYVGYVSGPRPPDAPRWGYLGSQDSVDELADWLHIRPHIQVDGFPIRNPHGR